MIHLTVLKKTPLFHEIADSEIESLLKCLSAKTETFKKNQFIFHAGSTTTTLGIVLSGCVHIIREDFWGNQEILSEITLGNLFGETYACLQKEPLSVSVLAVETTEVLFLNVTNMMTTCSSACQFHSRLMRNLLSVVAGKNLMLTKKIEHLAQRTTREKLLSYLSSESIRHGSADFQIPFNRQQLSDFLCVDRSAMSNELGKLRDEGILEFHKNQFQLKENWNHL